MYKIYLALNNLQWLICHKTKPNLIQLSYHFYIFEQQSTKDSIKNKTKPNKKYLCHLNFKISMIYATAVFDHSGAF